MTSVITTTEELDNLKSTSQTLSKSISDLDLSNLPMPYIEKDKILMSPGTWNGYFYSPDEVQKAFTSTDWNRKENKFLFLDHKDKDVSNWVGMIDNQRMDGQDLIGDLIIVDKPTARKLAIGAKFGVSSKIGGDGENGIMRNFGYMNFSVVINPAVKTAYINNSDNMTEEQLAEVTAMETKRKELGIGVSEFYAIPRDPPSASKLPIFDKAHVQNALARFNQVTGITSEEREKAMRKIKTAAKKFGIKVTKNNDNIKTEDDTMTEKELSTEEIGKVVLNSAWTDFVGKMKKEDPEMSFPEIVKRFKARKTDEDKVDETKAKPETKTEPVENGTKELSDLISNLTSKLDKMDTKLSETNDKVAKIIKNDDDKPEAEPETKPEEPAVEEPAKEEDKAEPVEKVDEPAEEKTDTPAEPEPETGSKEVKEMSEDKTERATKVVDGTDDTTKELSDDELDKVILRGMLIEQGADEQAKRI